MLSLEGVSIFYNDFCAAQNISFSLAKGQIGCLLGPSGCGKSSLLRAIAGFQGVSQGTIELRQQKVNADSEFVSPDKRRVAIVFQDFALFPHMNVNQNIAFAIPKYSNKSTQQVCKTLLALVGLPDIGERYIDALSGGQRQRVALARALATEPDILLLDEPFSSLDAELREALANELRGIIQRANVTALMVTHDQAEAFAIADKIGVMQEGQLLQFDTAENIYCYPSTLFVAEFIGKSSTLEAKLDKQGNLNTVFGEFTVDSQQRRVTETNVKLVVRPQHIKPTENDPVSCDIIAISYHGSHCVYQLMLPDGQYCDYYEFGLPRLKTGQSLNVAPEYSQLRCFIGSEQTSYLPIRITRLT